IGAMQPIAFTQSRLPLHGFFAGCGCCACIMFMQSSLICDTATGGAAFAAPAKAACWANKPNKAPNRSRRRNRRVINSAAIVQASDHFHPLRFDGLEPTTVSRSTLQTHPAPLTYRNIPGIEHMLNIVAYDRRFLGLALDRLSRSKSALQSKSRAGVSLEFLNFAPPSQVIRPANWAHRRRGAPSLLPLPGETGTNGICNPCHLHPNFPAI